MRIRQRFQARTGDIDAQFQQCVDIKRTLGHKVLQGRTLEQLHNYVRAAMFLSGPQEPPEGFRELAEGEILAVPRGLTEIEAL